MLTGVVEWYPWFTTPVEGVSLNNQLYIKG